MTSVPARALLDTGATVSGIGPRIVQALGLASHGKKRLKSATEEVFVDYFMFRIGFDVGETGFGDPAQLPFVFEATDGFSWGRSAEFDVILGMDVLRQCDFAKDRAGLCKLRFG